MHTVIVTRPEPLNQLLCEHLDRLGLNTFALPTLEVQPRPCVAELRAQIQNVDRYDGVICVSRPAAGWLVEHLDRFWPQLPVGIKWLAVGESSASILARAGMPVHCPEQGFNSEAMLAMAPLQAQSIQGQRWLLVKGGAGRALLAETLMARGAEVVPLEVYDRLPMRYPQERLRLLKEAIQLGSILLVVTSVDVLMHFWSIIEGMALERALLETLYTAPLITISDRIAERARSLGFRHTVLSVKPDNSEIIKVIKGLVDVK